MKQVILVVEGNVHAGKLYKSFIERSGHQVMVTDDAEKALKLACAWQPDLVMIDMHLADGASTRLIERLKHLFGSSTNLIVTFCDDLEKISSLTCQVDAMIHKPFDCRQLAIVVDAVLNRTTPGDAQADIMLVDRTVRQVSASSAA